MKTRADGRQLYQVVWIETTTTWHPAAAELPSEFRIVGDLQTNLTCDEAQAFATVANHASDLLHRRGRWAIVMPAVSN